MSFNSRLPIVKGRSLYPWSRCANGAVRNSNATNGHLQVIIPSPPESITGMAWINFQINLSTWTAIFAHDDHNWNYYMVGASPNLTVCTWNGTGTGNGSVFFVLGEWMHLAYTINVAGGAGSFLTYVNGVISNTSTKSTLDLSFSPLYIGGDFANEAFNGRWSNARWFGAVLTQEEIKQEMLSPVPYRQDDLLLQLDSTCWQDAHIDRGPRKLHLTPGANRLTTELGPPWSKIWREFKTTGRSIVSPVTAGSFEGLHAIETGV